MLESDDHVNPDVLELNFSRKLLTVGAKSKTMKRKLSSWKFIDSTFKQNHSLLSAENEVERKIT